MSKIGRNDPCHCGSGQKYKKCCLAKDDAARSAELAALAAEAEAAAAASEAQAEAEEKEKGGSPAAGSPRAAHAQRGREGAARPTTGAQPQPPPIRRKAV
jgi:hypothetical protein